MSQEQDDWETADFSTLPSTQQGQNKLRPTATAFQPKPYTAMANNQASSSRIQTQLGQRVFAPPGGGWNVDRPTRGDWDARKPIQGQGTGGPVSKGVEDTEDEWFRSEPTGRGASNRQLWDEANALAPPTTQISAPTALPPPQIKILRRQNANPSNQDQDHGGGGGGRSTPQKSFKEKEEEYRLARERIFGGSDHFEVPGSGSGGNSPIAGVRTPPSGIRRDTGVVRQPRGPGEGGGFGSGNGNGNGQSPVQLNGGGGGGFPPGW